MGDNSLFACGGNRLREEGKSEDEEDEGFHPLTLSVTLFKINYGPQADFLPLASAASFAARAFVFELGLFVLERL